MEKFIKQLNEAITILKYIADELGPMGKLDIKNLSYDIVKCQTQIRIDLNKAVVMIHYYYYKDGETFRGPTIVELCNPNFMSEIKKCVNEVADHYDCENDIRIFDRELANG